MTKLEIAQQITRSIEGLLRISDAALMSDLNDGEWSQLNADIGAVTDILTARRSVLSAREGQHVRDQPGLAI